MRLKNLSGAQMQQPMSHLTIKQPQHGARALRSARKTLSSLPQGGVRTVTRGACKNLSEADQLQSQSNQIGGVLP